VDRPGGTLVLVEGRLGDYLPKLWGVAVKDMAFEEAGKVDDEVLALTRRGRQPLDLRDGKLDLGGLEREKGHDLEMSIDILENKHDEVTCYLTSWMKGLTLMNGEPDV
jgi:hypothetical protein